MKVVELGLPEEVALGQLDAGSPRGTISWTPLQYACALGDEELVKELLARAIDPTDTGKTKYEYTPLHIAVRYGHHAIVDALIEAGAATIVPADAVIGASPLHLAAVRGDKAMIEKLLPVTDRIPETKNGTTPYELAKRLGHVQIAQLLMNHEQRMRGKQQLGDWLASIGMIEYAPQFHDAGYDDAHFLLLHGISDATLDAMKIDKPGHRIKLKSMYQLREFLFGKDESDVEEDDEDDDNGMRDTSGEEGSDEPLEDESNSSDDDDDDGTDDEN